MSIYTTETDSGEIIKIPLKFRGYKIKKPCGKGSFSSVVKVIDTDTKTAYAAKIIPKKGLKDKENIINMINNEITILQRANHPNIIQLYEIIELTTKDDSYTILIEEYCKKGNLLEYIINDGLQDDQEKRQISLGIIEAIKHLHSQGIAHCDIKPENVLLDSNKVPKLCDFNLSKFIQKDNNSKRGGSKPYAAPELFKFQSIDFLRADIWSLGIMIFSISEKRYPYKTVEDAHAGLLFLNSKDKKLNAFSKRCLKIDPLKRPTIDQLSNDPYLTLDGENEQEINDDDNNDDKMLTKKKEESMTKMKTSPDLADAKTLNKGEVILDNDGLPPISDGDDDDVDSEMAEDIFEMIYGYRRSEVEMDDSRENADDGHTEQTVYRRQKPDKQHQSDLQLQKDNNNNNNNNNDNDNQSNRQPLSISSSEISVTSSQNRSDAAIQNNRKPQNDNEIQNNRQQLEVNCKKDEDGLQIQSGSFAFSVMLELGYDFELQSQSESSQADDVNDKDFEVSHQDDFADYEIEKIEDRICDSIVKFKYEKKKKPKKKVNSHQKRKEKKDWKNYLDSE